MIKRYAECDEEYPFYTLTKTNTGYVDYPIYLTNEQKQKIDAGMKAYREAQALIKQLIDEQCPQK